MLIFVHLVVFCCFFLVFFCFFFFALVLLLLFAFFSSLFHCILYSYCHGLVLMCRVGRATWGASKPRGFLPWRHRQVLHRRYDEYACGVVYMWGPVVISPCCFEYWLRLINCCVCVIICCVCICMCTWAQCIVWLSLIIYLFAVCDCIQCVHVCVYYLMSHWQNCISARENVMSECAGWEGGG